MFYRFESRDGLGLFDQASTFEGRAFARELSRRTEREFWEHWRWLQQETPVPPSRAYKDTRSRFPKTWYKATASEHVRRAWLLSDIMSRHGLLVRPRKSRAPGVILFEDEVQVVVRPDREHVRIPAKRERPGAWDGDRTTIRKWRW